jgi:hypothetical protein
MLRAGQSRAVSVLRWVVQLLVAVARYAPCHCIRSWVPMYGHADPVRTQRSDGSDPKCEHEARSGCEEAGPCNGISV